jgi:MFS family permease
MKKTITLIRLLQVEPVLLIYMFSSSLSSPTEEGLLYKKVCLEYFDKIFCNDYFRNLIDEVEKYKIHKTDLELNLTILTNSNSYLKTKNFNFEKREDKIQREASKWIMYTNMAISVPSFITTLMFGAWSDSVNRKYPIMLSLIGLSISNLVYLLLSYDIEKYPLKLILLPNVLFGLFGSSNTLFSAIFSYVSYSSNENNRTVRLAFLESCIMIGGSIGLGISGLIIHKFGFFITFFIVLNCISLTIAYTLLNVKDIRPSIEFNMEKIPIINDLPSTNSKNVLIKLFTFSYFKETLSVCFTKRSDSVNLCIFLLVSLFMLSSFVTSGESSIAYLYLRKSSISLTQAEYGYYRAARTFLLGISLLIILPILKNRLNLSDSICIVIGTISRSIVDLIYAFANKKYQIFLSKYVYIRTRIFFFK